MVIEKNIDDINKFEGQVFAGASLGSLALALNINNNIIVDPFKDSMTNIFESRSGNILF